jgi:AcrR family transcriptional regulator
MTGTEAETGTPAAAPTTAGAPTTTANPAPARAPTTRREPAAGPQPPAGAAPTRVRGPRADAQRNRERLLEVARRALAADGDKVPLETIAREAGVGIGTLYRHFPTREALVEAVYRAELGRLCDSSYELLATRPPDDALRAWMDRFAGYVAAKREMADALRAVINSGAITSSQARAQLSAAVQALLDAGTRAGTLRPGVPAGDVVASLVGIFLACGQPEQRAQAGRMMDLLMAGLRATPSAPAAPHTPGDPPATTTPSAPATPRTPGDPPATTTPSAPAAPRTPGDPPATTTPSAPATPPSSGVSPPGPARRDVDLTVAAATVKSTSRADIGEPPRSGIS